MRRYSWTVGWLLLGVLGVWAQGGLFPPEAREEFAAAERLFRSQRYAEALARYRGLAERYPTAIAAHVGRALSAFQLGELEEAETAYRRALQLRPDDPVLLGGLGDVYRRAEKLTQAKEAYQAAIRLAGPRPFPTWFLGLGVLADREGDYATAERYYRQALERDPQLAPAWHNLGLALFHQGRLDEAERVLRKAISLRADKADTFYALGMIAQKRERWYAARDYLQRASELDPDEPTYYYARAQVLFRLGQRQEGMEALQRYRRAKAKRYHQEARKEMQAGQFLDALAKLQNARKTDPTYLPALLDRAYCLMRIGELEAARAGFREVLEANPHQSQAWLGLGLILAEQHRWDEAEQHFLRAIQENPDLSEAYRQLSRLRELRGDWDGAEAILTQGIARYPEAGAGYWLRGRVRQRRGDLEGAAEDFRRAVELGPDQPIPKHSLALVLLEQGRNLDEARRMVLDALALREEPIFWATLARIEAALGNQKAALQAIRKAYAQAPDDEYVSRWYRHFFPKEESQSQ